MGNIAASVLLLALAYMTYLFVSRLPMLLSDRSGFGSWIALPGGQIKLAGRATEEMSDRGIVGIDSVSEEGSDGQAIRLMFPTSRSNATTAI